MGDFLRWIMNDINKEEVDVLEGNKLTLKDIGRLATSKAKKWFINLLDEGAGIK